MKHILVFLIAVCAATSFSQNQPDQGDYVFKDSRTPTFIAEPKGVLKAGRPVRVRLTDLNTMKYSYKVEGLNVAVYSASLTGPLADIVSTFKTDGINLNAAGESPYKAGFDRLKNELLRAQTMSDALRVTKPNVGLIQEKVYSSDGSIQRAQEEMEMQKRAITAIPSNNAGFSLMPGIGAALKNFDYEEGKVEAIAIEIGKMSGSIADRAAEEAILFGGLTGQLKTDADLARVALLRSKGDALKVLAELEAYWRTQGGASVQLKRDLDGARSMSDQSVVLSPNKDLFSVRVTRKTTAAYSQWLKNRPGSNPDAEPEVVVESEANAVYGRRVVDTSVGFLATNLRNINYYKNSSNVITQNVSDTSDFAPALYIHYIPSTMNLGWGSFGLSLGVAKDTSRPTYFFGAGFHIGTDSRALVTVGVAYRSTNRLSDGQSVGMDIGASGAIKQASVTRFGLGIGLSFKIRI